MSLERIKTKLSDAGSSIKEGAVKGLKSAKNRLKTEYKLTKLNVRRNRPTSVILREAITPNPAPSKIPALEIATSSPATPARSLRQTYVTGHKSTHNSIEAEIQEGDTSESKRTIAYNTEGVGYYDVIGRNPLAFANVFHYPNIAISVTQACSLACCNTIEDSCSKLSATFCSLFCLDAFSTFCSTLCCVKPFSEDQSKLTERDSCWLAVGAKCFVACLCCSAKSSAAIVSHTLGALTDNYILHPIYDHTCAPELQNMDDNTSMRINKVLGLTSMQMRNLMAIRGYRWNLHHRSPTRPTLPQEMYTLRTVESKPDLSDMSDERKDEVPLPGAIPSPIPSLISPRSFAIDKPFTDLGQIANTSSTTQSRPSSSSENKGSTIAPNPNPDSNGGALHFPSTPNSTTPTPLPSIPEFSIRPLAVFYPESNGSPQNNTQLSIPPTPENHNPLNPLSRHSSFNGSAPPTGRKPPIGGVLHTSSVLFTKRLAPLMAPSIANRSSPSTLAEATILSTENATSTTSASRRTSAHLT